MARAQAPPNQPAAEVVTGRVTDDSARAVEGAVVVVTRGPDRLSILNTTDASGRYRVVFRPGSGDYLVHVSAPGYTAVRRRAMRPGTDTVLVVDVVLARSAAATSLSPVRITAAAPRPRRGPEFPSAPQPGGAERLADGVAGAVAPNQRGDLTAIAGTIPGVVSTPAGASTLGLGAEQSNVTLNGLAFAGAVLPPEARFRTRVSTAPFDPARGGFSSVQTAVELAPGEAPSSREARFVADAAPVSVVDPVTAVSGTRVKGGRASTGGDGEWVENRWSYNMGGVLARHTAPVATLFSAGPDVLGSLGIAADSAARLASVVRALGVPLGRAPAEQSTDDISGIMRVDFKPRAQRTWGVTSYLRALRTSAIGVTPSVGPGIGATRTEQTGVLQGVYSAYLGRGSGLNETRMSLSYSGTRNTPYSTLPALDVAVPSPSRSGDSTITSPVVALGGMPRTQTAAWTWEAVNETQWYTRGSPHRIKLTFESRLDGTRAAGLAGGNGVFRYASLADLAENRPASYTRVLGAGQQTGGEWSWFGALGDYWRPSPTLQVLYGVRLEGNRFTRIPAYNPAVDAAFGIRTNRVPNTLHLSPRLGLTWAYTGKPPSAGMRGSQLGTFFNTPRGLLRGGVGEFRDLLRPDLLAEASRTTGLPGSLLALRCVGPATPVPDWAAIAGGQAAPDACLSGQSDGLYSGTAPDVVAFDPSYAPPRSWRATLGWSGGIRALDLSVDGTASWNVDQPGIRDLNLDETPRFRLPEEGERPIFVPQAAIIPGTGVVSTLASRRNPAFGRVVLHRSDLRSFARQVIITASPRFENWARTHLSVSYIRTSARAQTRGYDGTTFGRPTDVEWAPAALDLRHQFQFQAGYLFGSGFSGTLFGRVSSGMPYTPIVGSDINGDGLANDRAFVFDPARTTDPSLAAGLQTLLRNAPAGARACLAAQLGRAVGQNSCRAPWSTTVNARLNWMTELPHTRRRLDVALSIINPLGGIDRLLHGAGQLRGWGTPFIPDPVLYTVRGFDPVRSRYVYQVNSRFGAVNPVRAALGAPFRLVADVRVDVGVPAAVQRIERVLSPGRRAPGQRLSADAIKARYARTVPDVYRMILAESDSLFLTPGQVDSLTAAEQPYLMRLDSVWTDLAVGLANVGDTYDVREALRRADDASGRAWEISRAQALTIRRILTPLQLRMVPQLVADVLNARGRIRMRYEVD